MDSWARSKARSWGQDSPLRSERFRIYESSSGVAGELFNWKIVRPQRQLVISQYFIDKFVIILII